MVLSSRYQSSVILVFSILYILTGMVSIGTSIYYLFFELLLSAWFLFLCFMKPGIFEKLPVGFYAISIIISLVSCLSYLASPESFIYNVHFIIYYFMCLIAFAFIRGKNIGIERVINGTNQFYIIYLTVCILLLLFNVKLGAYEVSNVHTLDAFNINKSVLLGLNGSPASIDSFSALVFLLNLFFKVSHRRKIMLCISLIAVVLTLRLTPVVAIMMSIFFYLVIYNRSTCFSAVLVLNSAFIAILYISWSLMQDAGSYHDQVYLLLHEATHSRFVIWGQQIEIMLNHYSFVNYIFGGFNNELFNVSMYRIDGEELTKTSYNPHSSVLLLFFRNPFLFIIIYLSYLFLMIKYFERRAAAISIFIFFCLIMNSSLLATGNPVFTIVMILLTLPGNIKQKTNSVLIRVRGTGRGQHTLA